MSGAVRPVHPALRGVLAGPLVAYDLLPASDTVHLGLPSATATVILAADEPLDVGWLASPERSTRHWASISGLHLAPALIRTHGVQRGIQLALTPAGCRSLFGVPLGSLAGSTVDLAELPRALRPDEYERVMAARSWRGRLAAVEALLLRRLDPSAPAADVGHAWQLLLDGARVDDTARAVGWSRRHLLDRVRAETGVSPKQIGRLGRFSAARRLVEDGVPLADAAHAAGFCDQSHLSREWRSMAGRPPTSREEFPKLHDVLLPPHADS